MKWCPRCQKLTMTGTGSITVKNAKILREFCIECGLNLDKDEVPVKLNPDNFIREG